MKALSNTFRLAVKRVDRELRGFADLPARIDMPMAAVTFVCSWLLIAGCGGSSHPPSAAPAPPVATPPSMNNYIGTLSEGLNLFSIDAVTSQTSQGNYTLSQGFLDLGIQNGAFVGYGLNLPGAAVLYQTGQSLTPFAVGVAAPPSCPVYASKTRFDFVTMPGFPSDPIAYGSFSAATNADGSQWSFSEQTQTALPGNFQKQSPYPTSFTGSCAQGSYGYVVSTPATVSYPTTSIIAIGPTGFMIDDQGPPSSHLSLAGFAAPSIPPITANVAAAKYLGFRYAVSTSGSVVQPVYFNQAVPGSQTAIRGGEFPLGDNVLLPAASPDMTLDLGAQDAKNNGLYPSAQLTLPDPMQSCAAVPGKDAVGNPNCTYPAAAIVGNPGGSFAIFIVSVGAPAIYLYQQ